MSYIAAIEASRAGSESGSGSTGQGSGVVAEKVRQLAEETDQATTEIAEIIGAVQTETQEAVKAARQSSANAEVGIGLSREASAVLDEIVDSIGRVEQMTDEVAAASEQQSATSEEIARSVESISTSLLPEPLRRTPAHQQFTPAFGRGRRKRGPAPLQRTGA